MPPVKTSVSSPPSTAVHPATDVATAVVDTSSASRQSGSPAAARPVSSATSVRLPLIPARPEDRSTNQCRQVRGGPPAVEEEQQHRGVEVPAAADRGQPAGGGEAHRGLHRPAAGHRRDAAAPTEVGHDRPLEPGTVSTT